MFRKKSRELNETEEYVFDVSKTWIWSGFRTLEQVYELMDDIIEENCDAKMLRHLASLEYKTKLRQEKSWPNVTSCDRLDAAFDSLRSQGYIALQNAGYTTTDGHEDVDEVAESMDKSNIKGFCFYHGQDLERAVHGEGLYIAFGDLEDREAIILETARVIVSTLKEHGFDVEWDGTKNSRVSVGKFEWMRRAPR